MRLFRKQLTNVDVWLAFESTNHLTQSIMYLKISIIMFLTISAFFTNCFNASKSKSHQDIDSKATTTSTATSFYDLKATSIDGTPISMSQYKGKKIVVLNVASKCGYTPQYADWQGFYESHKERFVVLGFPCNQFLSQEPGTSAEIQSFCQKNYGVTFQMFEKVNVKGADKNPIYQWLTDPAQNGWNDTEPSWNFSKYLIDENGKLLNYFGPKIKPDSPEFLAAIK